MLFIITGRTCILVMRTMIGGGVVVRVAAATARAVTVMMGKVMGQHLANTSAAHWQQRLVVVGVFLGVGLVGWLLYMRCRCLLSIDAVLTHRIGHMKLSLFVVVVLV